MFAFLLVLVLSIALVYFGVSVSYRVYKSGAISSRRMRSARRFRPLPVGPSIDEDMEFESFQAATDDVTSRYARNGLLAMVIGAVVLATLVITVLSAMIH
jgi:hypothetical protein